MMSNLFMLLMVTCLTTYSYANDWYLKTQLKINFTGRSSLYVNNTKIDDAIDNNKAVADSLELNLSKFYSQMSKNNYELKLNDDNLISKNNFKERLDISRLDITKAIQSIIERKKSTEQIIDDKTTTLSYFTAYFNTTKFTSLETQQQTIINNLNNYYQRMIVSDALTEKDKVLLNQQKDTIDSCIALMSNGLELEGSFEEFVFTDQLQAALLYYEFFFSRINPTENFEVPEVTEIMNIFSDIAKPKADYKRHQDEIKQYEEALATLVKEENEYNGYYTDNTETAKRTVEEAKAIENSIKTINAAIKQLNEQIKTAEQQQTEVEEKIKALFTLAKTARKANEQYVADANKKINNYYLYDTYARLVSLGYNLNNNFAVELSLASANLVTSFNLTPKSSLYLHAGVSVYNLAEYGVGFKYNNISLGLMVQHPRNIVDNKFVYEGITFVNNFDTEGLKVGATLSYSF